MLKERLAVTDVFNIVKVTNPMKTRKIVAVGGQPGTGKTTLFRKFIESKEWIEVEPAKLVSALYNQERDLYILGKYQKGKPSLEQIVFQWQSSHLFKSGSLLITVTSFSRETEFLISLS